LPDLQPVQGLALLAQQVLVLQQRLAQRPMQRPVQPPPRPQPEPQRLTLVPIQQVRRHQVRVQQMPMLR
jgi:hypothetical protein